MKRIALALLALAATLLAGGCAAGFRAGAQDVTPTSATLVGVVASDRSEAGTYFFKYGERLNRDSYASVTPTRTIRFTARQGQRVEEAVGGLRPATPYHFAVCADDQERLGPFCTGEHFLATPGVAGNDFAVASGTVGFCDGFLASTAQSGPQGQSPSGSVRFCGFGGDVVCLRVTGNTAFVKVPSGFTSATGPPYFDLKLTDNGSSGDRIEGENSYSAACPATEDGHDLDLEFEGDLRVGDAQPAG